MRRVFEVDLLRMPVLPHEPDANPRRHPPADGLGDPDVPGPAGPRTAAHTGSVGSRALWTLGSRSPRVCPSGAETVRPSPGPEFPTIELRADCAANARAMAGPRADRAPRGQRVLRRSPCPSSRPRRTPSRSTGHSRLAGKPEAFMPPDNLRVAIGMTEIGPQTCDCFTPPGGTVALAQQLLHASADEFPRELVQHQGARDESTARCLCQRARRTHAEPEHLFTRLPRFREGDLDKHVEASPGRQSGAGRMEVGAPEVINLKIHSASR